MRKKTGLFLLFFFVFSWLPGPARAVDVDELVPDFELSTLGGGSFSYGDIKGEKPLFLVFWATWCSECKREVPRLKEVYSRFNPKGLSFLAVNVGVNDSADRAGRYVKKYGLTYPVAFDEGSRITREFGVMGTPTVIIVDRQGVVRYRSSAVPEDLGEHYDDLVN
jgi:peroxiredoxin